MWCVCLSFFRIFARSRFLFFLFSLLRLPDCLCVHCSTPKSFCKYETIPKFLVERKTKLCNLYKKQGRNRSKFAKKKLRKGIDKGEIKWYNNWAVNERRQRTQLNRVNRKKLEKSFKKVLTKRSGCDIIYRLSTRGDSELAHWKLNNKNVLKRLRKFFWIFLKSLLR